MYLLILYFPLVASISCGFFGRFLGKNGSIYIILLCMLYAVINSFFVFRQIVIGKKIVIISLFDFIDVLGFSFQFELLFDALSSTMIVIIISISFIVHIFAIDYMSKDPHLIRFLAFLSLFTFFMLLLVTSGNYIIFFIGWEGIGICSYFLINF